MGYNMNTDQFTGRTQAYVKARPSYPNEAMEYIYNLAPPNAVFADVGAGTGKFTELLARYGNEILAVEPNNDMREQLILTLAPFPNTKIFDGTAEVTKLPDKSVDIIVCAQSLNKFDIEAFRVECQRISKSNPFVITLWNNEQGEKYGNYSKSTNALYKNPIIREFPNPVYYTRDNWVMYHTSMAGVPMEFEQGHEAYMAKFIEIFDRDNVDGVYRHDFVTVVYSEKLD